jgi:hypothetical protein
MADIEIGELGIVPVTSSQIGKVSSFNGHETSLLKSTAGLLYLDAEGLSGTEVLTETYSKNGHIQIQGALAGDLTVELDASIRQAFWVVDVSTGGVVTMKPTGGTGIILPKNRWVNYFATQSYFTKNVAGWASAAQAPALSFAANYQVVAARPLKIRKAGASNATAGGRVTLEGCVEETTDAPAAGDTIVTLPALYRPSYAIGAVCLADPATEALAEPVAIEIQTDGTVILRSLLNWTPLVDKPIDLSGISFFVGN